MRVCTRDNLCVCTGFKSVIESINQLIICRRWWRRARNDKKDQFISVTIPNLPRARLARVSNMFPRSTIIPTLGGQVRQDTETP